MSDETKRIILARRARFVAAALASVAATATAIGASTEACGGDTEQIDDGQADGGNPQPCLKVAPDASPRDAGPQPCLVPELPSDAGEDGSKSDGGKDGGKDAGPQPCLIAPLDGG